MGISEFLNSTNTKYIIHKGLFLILFQKFRIFWQLLQSKQISSFTRWLLTTSACNLVVELVVTFLWLTKMLRSQPIHLHLIGEKVAVSFNSTKIRYKDHRSTQWSPGLCAACLLPRHLSLTRNSMASMNLNFLLISNRPWTLPFPETTMGALVSPAARLQRETYSI